MDTPPFRSLRVVELGTGIASAYCTKMLADLGADVVKVEDTNEPDPGRFEPPMVTTVGGTRVSGSFLYLNTSKKSVTLDLASTTGRDLLLRLVRRSDLLVISLDHEELESLGLAAVLDGAGHGDLKSLVVTSVSPFGRTGPYSGFAGTEIVVSALGGWIYGLGDAAREPRRPPGSHGLMIAGVYAFIASVAALYQSTITGQGQHVDVSAMEAVLWSQMNITTTYEYSGHIWRRHGDRSPMSHPQGLYECKDGLIGVNVLYYAEWDRFPDFVGIPELKNDPRFTTPLDRAQNAAALDAIIDPWLRSHTRMELYRMAQENKIPFALVNSPADLLASRHLVARGFWATVPVPELGDVVMPGLPFRLGSSRWEPRWNAPSPGQHNDEVHDVVDKARELVDAPNVKGG